MSSQSDWHSARNFRMQQRQKQIALEKAAPALLDALEKAREDINWMLNRRRFLKTDQFNYIDNAIAAAKGE